MQSSTDSELAETRLSQAAHHPVLARWAQVARCLPHDLDESAYRLGALRRRRKLQRAADLLRLIFAYSVCDWPLRLVGSWATLVNLAELSDVAILRRLCASPRWLGFLMVSLLQKRQLRLTRQAGVRLRLMDATALSLPGSRGSDWRVHLSLDLEQLCLDGVEVTAARGAETLARFPLLPGEIRVADRGYAFASGLVPVLAAGGQVVVRLNWCTLPLYEPHGGRFRFTPWLAGRHRLSEHRVTLLPDGRWPLRLLACPLPAAAAQRARRRARHMSARKGHTPQRGTLLAAGFVLLLTNLPAEQWSPKRVAELYRVRWQIELLIKRLKSLVQLDAVRADDPQLVQTYLLGKLLAALLTEELVGATAEVCPQWFASTERPLSLWRLMQFWWQHLQQLVRGSMTLQRIEQCLPRLGRYFRDAPRRRRQQLATARSLYTSLFAY
jgi:hypothetical protein